VSGTKSWENKRVLVTGGSAGLGLAIARCFAAKGARVAIVGRDQAKLDNAVANVNSKALAAGNMNSKALAAGDSDGRFLPITGDITRPEDVDRIFQTVRDNWNGLDVLVNNAGRSSRGTIAGTPPDVFRELWELNFLAALRCTQHALPMLLAAKGHLVNIGSLGAKSASKYLGAYPTSKFPLAALSQQLRLEHAADELHVLLVCPGPIARNDAGARYAAESESLPDEAAQPGGGVKVKSIDPGWLAGQIVRACERRKLELIVPGKARLLFAIQQLFPSWGDWIVGRMTSG